MMTGKNIWLLAILTAISALGFAQTPSANSAGGTATHGLEEDDPILEALDNMITLEHFRNSSFTTDTNILNIYKYKRDSIPVFEDAVYAYRLKQLDNKSPFSLVYNEPVKNYIDAYARRNKDKVGRLLGLGEMYFPMMEEILDRYDMPLELKYLAVIESALNPNARSRSGAVGLWQFIYRTGKLYNLNVTSYVDERSDPYLETVAACEYLKYLYNMFGNWELALAAYNGGPGTLNKAIRRSGGKMDYWALRPYLPVETRGYVPAFIAVNYVMNYASAHNIYPQKPLALSYELDTVHVKEKLTFATLSRALDMPIEDIETLNPVYKKQLIPKGTKPMSLVLPRNKIGFFLTNEKAIYALDNAVPTIVDKPETVVADNITEVRHTHKVQRGENLGTIASRYKCTVGDLKEWNGLKGTMINEGQKLTVYMSERPTSESGVAKGTGNKSYTIRSGDTLWGIAKQNNMSIDDLLKLNNMSQNEPLKVGAKIKIG